MERTKQGEFAWTDLSATDLEGQTAFYEGLLGWEHHDVPMGEGATYRIFTIDGGTVSGASVMSAQMAQSGVPSMWNVYIAVGDLDASLARAVELGGQVAMPVTPVGPQSRFAAIMDPTGAPVFLWQNGAPDEKQVYDVPGALAWNDLMTWDPAKAADFFTKLVGWDIAKMDEGQEPYWQVNIDGTGEGGIMPMPEMVPPEVPSYWLDYFATTDIAASVAKAKGLGATATVEPMQVGDMLWFAVLTDPAGATFALLQPLMST
jgi:predicted enzyme related to lactoylglutathione lyase